MSETRKANVEGGLYFMTITVVGWIDVFTRKELAAELIDHFEWNQRNKGLKLFAYVIMPNHVHFVAHTISNYKIDQSELAVLR